MILRHEMHEPSDTTMETWTATREILSEASELTCPNLTGLVAFLIDRLPDHTSEQAP